MDAGDCADTGANKIVISRSRACFVKRSGQASKFTSLAILELEGLEMVSADTICVASMRVSTSTATVKMEI